MRKHSTQAAQRVGTTQVMNSGEVACIIAYHNCDNIDIQFEDGTIRKGVQYSHFLKGNVRKEKLISNEESRRERVGKIALANNGQQMMVIGYRNVTDIDIRFADGTIVYNKGYYDFLAGEIENPNYKSDVRVSINEFALLWYFRALGFERFKQGSLKEYGFNKMELDCFNPVLKVAIEYDGYRWHDGDENFQRDTKKSQLCKENEIHLIRIRDYRLSPIPGCKNFMLKDTSCFSSEMAVIIKDVCDYLQQEYKLNINLDVNFKRDKEFILNDFGQKYRSSKIGTESINSAGLKMKIIAYRTYADIDVEFEDGAIKKNVRYERFIHGDVRHPVQTAEGKKLARIGNEAIMNCGLQAKIITYRRATDIDVLFSDGSIVKHTTYDCFKKGTILPHKKIEKI